MHGWGYTAVGKDGKSPDLHNQRSGILTSRIIVLIVVVALVVGALIFLSSQAREVPTRTIETEVTQSANAS